MYFIFPVYNHSVDRAVVNAVGVSLSILRSLIAIKRETLSRNAVCSATHGQTAVEASDCETMSC